MMKLLESKLLESDVVELTLENPSQRTLNWSIGESAELFEDNGLFYLKQGNCFEEITFSHLPLAKAVNKNDPQVVLAVICYKNATTVAVKFMYLRDQCPENITINLDHASISTIAKVSGVEVSFTAAQYWFEQSFYFNHQQKNAMLCEFHATALGDNFKIIGEKYAVSIIKNGKYWFINTITPLKRLPEKLTLFCGEHQLLEYIASNAVNEPTQQLMLEQHTKEHGSYFQLWLKYSEVHWQQASRIAKSTGYLSYCDRESISDEKIRFSFLLGEASIRNFIDKYKAELETIGERFNINHLELQVAEDAPDYLTEVDKSLEFSTKQKKKPIFLSDLKFTHGQLEATLSKKPPNKGAIYISLNGIQKQQQRKMSAFEMLRQGNNPLPQIKHLLEGLQPPQQRAKRIKGLSKNAKARFKGEPTRQQEKALKIALRTPDVALIIGPPGTGKTQVISALQQRIAEEGDKFGSTIQHQVLLSSYQHDAVTNVVERSGVFGLPALKIGGREKNKNSDSGVTHWIEQRIDSLSHNISNELQQFDEYKLFESINELVLSIRLSAKPSDLKSLLLSLRKKLDSWQIDYGFNIDAKILDGIDALTMRFANLLCITLSTEQRKMLYRKVRGLRTSEIAFDDDGLLRSQDLLNVLKSLDETQKYAQQLQVLIDINPSAFKFEPFKQRLLEALVLPYVIPDARHVTENEIEYLELLQQNLEQTLTNNPTLGKLYFRQQYMDTLHNQPALVERSIAEYVTVLGATCQQAAGDKMVSLKSVKQSESITFDSVIVDEAARANPLDLMIPMAMARTRVVLVGDHKQLPHMLEPQVEKELQDKNEIEITDQELLKESLFERLYHDLTKFEQEGGPKRVVMLDTQFRMHPVLGDFHSKEFYESAGLPAVKSGLESKDFPLDVPNYDGKLAAWINVGKAEGKMDESNGSKYRQCEAIIVAEEAANILNERPDLSVGIITFYAAQRDRIQDLMVEKGIMKKSFDNYEPAQSYASLSNGDERFRVGSVDAFQGKEFDVVLLSTVRSWHPVDSFNSDIVNKQLGFLRIINRINVAMSRQKRLLIVVGDKSLADPKLAKTIEFENGTKQQVLPGFNAFYQLCQGEHGCVR
ncbi:MAG: AAA family ATPase [Endozoicomonadaceae bacterium]|nr:AAA family ATPase [Endozoicomonadaceae bacterium]